MVCVPEHAHASRMQRHGDVIYAFVPDISLVYAVCETDMNEFQRRQSIAGIPGKVLQILQRFSLDVQKLQLLQ